MMDVHWCSKYAGLLVSVCLCSMVSFIMATTICQTGYYYDAVTRSCAHCSDICEAATIKRTQSECRRRCPDFLETDPKLVTTTIPPDTGLNATYIVLIIVVLIATICASVLLVCIILKHRRAHTPQQADNEQGYNCCNDLLPMKKRQSTVGGQHDQIPLSEQTNEATGQPMQQPQDDDARSGLLVSGAASSKQLEPDDTDTQTYRKEVSDSQAQV